LSCQSAEKSENRATSDPNSWLTIYGTMNYFVII